MVSEETIDLMKAIDVLKKSQPMLMHFSCLVCSSIPVLSNWSFCVFAGA